MFSHTNLRKLDWEEEAPTVIPEKLRKTAVILNVFDVAEFEEDPALLLDLKQDIWDECGRCGVVTNVVIYDVRPSLLISYISSEFFFKSTLITHLIIEILPRPSLHPLQNRGCCPRLRCPDE